MSLSVSSKRSRRGRKNKAPRITGNEVVFQGSPVGPRIVQPIFPLSTSFDNKVFNIIKSVKLTDAVSSNVANTYTAYNFQLGDVGDNVSLGNIFDQYRIMMVELEFIPGSNSQTSAANNMGLFTTVLDYDDSSVLTSIASALDYSSAITTEGYERQRRVLVPKVAVAAYAGAFTAYAVQTQQWIDVASSTVQHYGCKTAWTPTSTNGVAISVIAKYWLQFRCTR